MGHGPRRFDPRLLLSRLVLPVLPVASGRTDAAVLWSIAACFAALFWQNTITLAPALAAYDLIIGRRPLVSWAWLRPYTPFVLLTAGYLLLRYAVFGQVA